MSFCEWLADVLGCVPPPWIPGWFIISVVDGVRQEDLERVLVELDVMIVARNYYTEYAYR